MLRIRKEDGCEGHADEDEKREHIARVKPEDVYKRQAAGRAEVRAETWAYPGEGAKRAVDYLEGKYAALNAETGKAPEAQPAAVN